MNLEIYSYCNYKDSAVGFQIGKVNLNSGKIYRDNSIPQYIIQSFESGLINCASGKYPQKGNEKYFYLMKRIDYLNHDPEQDRYINIAFEFGNLSDFIKFKNYFKSKTVDEISALFGQMISPDTSNLDYEMRFDVKQINSFISQIEEQNVVVAQKSSYDYYYVFSSYNHREQELSNLLGLKKLNYELEDSEPKGNQYKYSFCKKKVNRMMIIILLILVLGLGFVAVSLIFSMEKRDNNINLTSHNNSLLFTVPQQQN